jgi:hypothetical protein
MKHRSKLTPLEQEQQHALEQQTQKQSVREFASAEEMLRHDAAQTTVPPAIAKRLQQSTSQASPPVRPWWRRWLGS